MPIIIIIIILVITYMHGVYNYIPDTKHVPRLYSAAAVLYLQFVLHVILFRPSNMFCTFILKRFQSALLLRYHFRLHIPHVLNLYCNVFIF
jgi:hypothetical protein